MAEMIPAVINDHGYRVISDHGYKKRAARMHVQPFVICFNVLTFQPSNLPTGFKGRLAG